jgi:hypothetical protein
VTEGVTIALISVIGGGMLTAFIAWLTRLSGRLGRLERRDKLSWLYIRSLIDHAYKHAPGVPLPEPPDGWLDEIE